MNELHAQDFLGNKISDGDTIVYPVRKGSRMWLSKMQVSGVICTGDTFQLNVFDPEAAARRNHRVKNLNTVVVVTSLT